MDQQWAGTVSLSMDSGGLTVTKPCAYPQPSAGFKSFLPNPGGPKATRIPQIPTSQPHRNQPLYLTLSCFRPSQIYHQSLTISPFQHAEDIQETEEAPVSLRGGPSQSRSGSQAYRMEGEGKRAPHFGLGASQGTNQHAVIGRQGT